ncbi:hypothetical protein ACFQ2M_29575 [Kitasatospora saccharophila]|uniref:hypothetical protein n=1 Tax=Kitasatospora saccharophila TaxID=407973 RepID=UPI003645D964
MTRPAAPRRSCCPCSRSCWSPPPPPPPSAGWSATPSGSSTTAKAHVARLFAKLDARDRVHLAILAYRAGLVTP